MFYRYLSIGHIVYFLLNIQNTNGFICPKDGRWPHPADCEKFYTCNGGIGTEAWCGNGMTYDIENSRCDLSKNINCRNGERPKRVLHVEQLQTEIITSYILQTTTPSLSNDEVDVDEQDRTTTISTRTTTAISNKAANSKTITSSNSLIENSPCTFQGSRPDEQDCQSYFTCKDNQIIRVHCPDKHLFDEYLRSCNDYRKVFCGNRPSDQNGNDPCRGQPNGWYADYGSHCRSYYLCTEQRRTKFDECPVGSRWNPHRLRCDDPRYIAAPCGYRSNKGISLSGDHCFYSTIIMTLTYFLLPF